MDFPVFQNKNELREWFQLQHPNTIKEYCKETFLKRKKEKGLIYTPTQVELRSLPEFPSLSHLNKIFKDYYTFCYLLGFKNKHRRFSDLTTFEPVSNYDKIVYIDSREQKPLDINNLAEVKALKFGDYTLSCKETSGNTYIERKSLTDLIGTISKGYERFTAEIERSIEAKAHLIILVEEDLNKALMFDKLTWINKFTKAKPHYIFHKIRDLIQTYPTIQFVFVPGRVEAARVVKHILYNGKFLQTFDLQYLFDSNVL
jgi:hypothetical protein